MRCSSSKPAPAGSQYLVTRTAGVRAGPQERRLAAGVGALRSHVRPDARGLDFDGVDARVVDGAVKRLSVLAHAGDAVPDALREIQTLGPVGTPFAPAGFSPVDELLVHFGEAGTRPA